VVERNVKKTSEHRNKKGFIKQTPWLFVARNQITRERRGLLERTGGIKCTGELRSPGLIHQYSTKEKRPR
jgi:hypothetical protein